MRTNARSNESLAYTGANQPLLAGILGSGPLFWAARDAVLVGDVATGRIVLWNPAAEEIFGYSAEEAIGLPVEDLVPERVRERFRTAMEAFAAEGPDRPGDEARTMELPALRRSGAEFFIEFSASPFERSDSCYMLGIVRDCTERKKVEAERDAFLADAQESARRISELASLKADFTAMVAHELGTPLATISALVDLLDRDEMPEKGQKRALATIRAETVLLRRLVSDIHVTVASEREDFAICPEPTPVSVLLDEAEASFTARLADHDFQVEPAPDMLVMVDCERIGQVLRNLLDNSMKYTPAGTKVVLRAREAEGRVYIEVTDRGPGIPSEDLSRIFAKFGRGRDGQGRHLPGFGLGLYLSRRIVRLHGGKLMVESEPGEGTTFRFDLEKVS
jgi:PAS domain S-box-containing protein